MLFLQKRAEESGEDSDDNAAKIDGKLMQLAFDVRSAAGLRRGLGKLIRNLRPHDLAALACSPGADPVS
jgi:hypothetical protein